MILIRYSIVIMLLALAMFFWLDVWEPGFVPVCITMAFCFICFSFGLLRLIRDGEKPVSKKRAWILFTVYVVVCFLAVLVKYLQTVLA